MDDCQHLSALGDDPDAWDGLDDDPSSPKCPFSSNTLTDIASRPPQSPRWSLAAEF